MVIELIDGSGVVLNSKNIAELYNFVVTSDKVKEIGMALRYNYKHNWKIVSFERETFFAQVTYEYYRDSRPGLKVYYELPLK